jgi:hypothetical protein
MSTNTQVSRIAWWAAAAIIAITPARPMAQNLTPQAAQQAAEAAIAKAYAHRAEIEAEVTFFRDESDAIRVAAGEARAPDAEDCALQSGIAATSYLCPARRVDRDRFKSALLSRGWVAVKAPTSDSPYALDAFRKGITLASFVCVPDRKECLLELKRPPQAF